MEQRFSRKPYIVIGIFFVVISAMVSYIVGGNPLLQGTSLQKNPRMAKTTAEKLFGAQTTSITGKIISVQSNMLTVKNDKGIVGTVELADTIIIQDFTNNQQRDRQRIETGKQVTLLLQLFEDRYKVITLNYVPEIPALPEISPVSSYSALDNPVPVRTTE